jgi:5-methylcytosine-specific restriction endonuclease McrA
VSRVPSTIRAQVRQRADDRFEYCHQLELFSPYSYHVDHILPVKRHGGSDGVENLAWACFECNTNKAGDISAYDYETKELTPLYNPRTQLWDDHFEMQSALIAAKTAVGRVTIRLLQLNESHRVESRQNLSNKGRW